MFFFLLFFAHLQAVIVPIIFGIKSINKFKNIENHVLIPFGFIFLGLASMFEMIDHTKTNWIYIDHSSLFNWFFYTFLALGLTSFTISVIKNKFAIGTNIFLCFCSIVSYFQHLYQAKPFGRLMLSIFLQRISVSKSLIS